MTSVWVPVPVSNCWDDFSFSRMPSVWVPVPVSNCWGDFSFSRTSVFESICCNENGFSVSVSFF